MYRRILPTFACILPSLYYLQEDCTTEGFSQFVSHSFTAHILITKSISFSASIHTENRCNVACLGTSGTLNIVSRQYLVTRKLTMISY